MCVCACVYTYMKHNWSIACSNSNLVSTKLLVIGVVLLVKVFLLYSLLVISVTDRMHWWAYMQWPNRSNACSNSNLVFRKLLVIGVILPVSVSLSHSLLVIYLITDNRQWPNRSNVSPAVESEDTIQEEDNTMQCVVKYYLSLPPCIHPSVPWLLPGHFQLHISGPMHWWHRAPLTKLLEYWRVTYPPWMSMFPVALAALSTNLPGISLTEILSAFQYASLCLWQSPLQVTKQPSCPLIEYSEFLS